MIQEVVGHPLFPPEQIVQVKAIACQLPVERGLPLSRFSLREIQAEVEQCPLITSISTGTIWRILNNDAIRPWYHQSWLFIKDLDFVEKASRVLDLYEGIFEGEPLGKKDFVISADEKSQLQILRRACPTLPAGPNRPMRYENDYKREGTVAYLSALDVCSGQVFGIVEDKTGIKPFQKLVDTVMGQEPYKSAHRVFWIVDNGSSHSTTTFQKRLAIALQTRMKMPLRCICPFTPVGLTRLKSIFLSYKERHSHPMTWEIDRRWKTASSAFRNNII